ncbi:hypothetical protein HU830_06340 [Lactobacillus sp. DCY120]|uniref:Uncharacterized protein n=1 Tax=Bombilactobacillus apium TaxID=2675299 RepID=A0A850R1H1_9LACO|nr:hypothetical protein [Bombilactobacillus apium]NVY96773.1 hypothetical protein [Bombilactobacillus apium]
MDEASNKNEFKLKLVKKMYKKDLETIVNINNIRCPVYNKSEMIAFNSLDLEQIERDKSLVVGGACIDRCQGKIENLGINFYYDILMPINFALEYPLPIGIYVDTPIEVEFRSPANSEIWLKFIDQVEFFLNNLSKKIKKTIRVIRRDKGVNILDNILSNLELNDVELKGLYDLVPSKKNLFTKELLLNFKRSICSYFPIYLSDYFDKNIVYTVVVEELSQIKAVNKAKSIAPNIFFEDYLDMPSITCKNRMHRSPTGKVGIFDNLNSINGSTNFDLFINKINMQQVFEIFKTNNFFEICKILNTMWEE